MSLFIKKKSSLLPQNINHFYQKKVYHFIKNCFLLSAYGAKILIVKTIYEIVKKRLNLF